MAFWRKGGHFHDFEENLFYSTLIEYFVTAMIFSSSFFEHEREEGKGFFGAISVEGVRSAILEKENRAREEKKGE